MKTKAGRSIRFWGSWNTLGLLCGIAAGFMAPTGWLQLLSVLPEWTGSCMAVLLFGAGCIPFGWLLAPVGMAEIGFLCAYPIGLAIAKDSFAELLLTITGVGLPMAWLIPWGLLTASYSALCAWNRWRILRGKPRQFDAKSQTRSAWMRFLWTFSGTTVLQLFSGWILRKGW